ncbi:acyl carrier protein [Marinicella sediminis]|uniref:Acyl carrier protein n=1 Tax=Marinicella sediminis TaxID=1792834 RepID=A0ABV7JI89_9GAMM|nr:acyl carrier protein [Marinicella sediminis]
MEKKEIFDAVVQNTTEVLPSLTAHEINSSDALKDLGANSMDRSEIVMMTLESLSLNVPLVELAGATNIGELVDLLYEKQ